MKIIECEQRSVEWFECRRGVPTASDFDKIVTSEGKPSKQRTKYMYELAGQKLGGLMEEGYTSAAMQRGILLEEEARLMYSTNIKTVITCGFCLTDYGWGCSPDGLVDDDGLIEIKCPSLAVHVEYLLKRECPTDYWQQVQGQLLVTGRNYNDFVSYYPGVRPLIVRVKRNEEFIKLLSKELTQFICELDELVNKLK